MKKLLNQLKFSLYVIKKSITIVTFLTQKSANPIIRFGMNVFKKGDLGVVFRGRIMGNKFSISAFEFSLLYFV